MILQRKIQTIGLVALLAAGFSAHAAVCINGENVTGTCEVPANVTGVTIEGWGGGGGGGGAGLSGGGGGGSANPAFVNGGAGGTGVVILSVPTTNYSGTTTGSPTVTTSGSNTIIKFTASGTYTA